jgi:Zn-finger nucleic acid-binding protein
MELSPVYGFYKCRYCGTYHFPETVDDQGVRVLGPADRAIDCPLCRKALLVAMLDAYQVHYCQSCRGLLIPRPAFAEIVRHRRAWAIRPSITPVPPEDRALRRTIDCPTCRRRMIADRYYGPGNIIMDGCLACDVIWLDFGELQQIVDAPGADRGTRDLS